MLFNQYTFDNAMLLQDSCTPDAPNPPLNPQEAPQPFKRYKVTCYNKATELVETRHFTQIEEVLLYVKHKDRKEWINNFTITKENPTNVN